MERGYVGLRLQELTSSIASALGQPDLKGALIASVEPRGPADEAGVRAGDVVTGVNGQPVEGPRDLSRAVADMRPGTQASFTLRRGDRMETVTVTIGQRKDDMSGRPDGSQDADPDGKRLGLALAPIDEEARRRLGPDAAGVLVQQVAPNSPAAENGIRPGDVIMSANNREVSQPSDVADEWAKARSENKPILLRIKRGDQYLFVAIAA